MLDSVLYAYEKHHPQIFSETENIKYKKRKRKI